MLRGYNAGRRHGQAGREKTNRDRALRRERRTDELLFSPRRFQFQSPIFHGLISRSNIVLSFLPKEPLLLGLKRESPSTFFTINECLREGRPLNPMLLYLQLILKNTGSPHRTLGCSNSTIVPIHTHIVRFTCSRDVRKHAAVAHPIPIRTFTTSE